LKELTANFPARFFLLFCYDFTITSCQSNLIGRFPYMLGTARIGADKGRHVGGPPSKSWRRRKRKCRDICHL